MSFVSIMMAQAQARRNCTLCRANSLSLFSTISFSIFVVLLSLAVAVKAESQGFLNNGRFFTAALAISNSPQPGSPIHAGSDLVISIENPTTLLVQLSGDGRIPQSAFSPGSGLPTRYDSLELFLVSTRLDTNLTVSSGPELLNQEPGSTVKHLNWPIPECIPPGEYNLTYYEGSTVNDEPFFSITTIPVTVNNPGATAGSRCPSSNPVQGQPQPDSAPSVHPYLDTTLVLETSRPIPSQDVPRFVPTAPQTQTQQGTPTSTFLTNTERFVTVTQSPGQLFSNPQSTTTFVVVSSETLVTTTDNLEFTTTELTTNTITAAVDVNIAATGVLFRVNASLSMFSFSLFSTLIAPLLATLFLRLS